MSKGKREGIKFGSEAPTAASLDARYTTAPSPFPAWMQDRKLLPKRPPTAKREGER